MQLKIRHDHWVPFLVMSGLKYGQGVDKLIDKCVEIHASPKGYYRLPIRRPADKIFTGWKIPEEVETKTVALCNALNSEIFTDAFKNLDRRITLHWERDEYRFLVEKSDLMWPEYVEHKKLKLLRNRYPVVPGFDNNTRMDRYQPPEPATPLPTSPKDFMKKPTTWKVKNIIPKTGVVHRYASKFGKRFPIMRKTAETSKYSSLKNKN